MTPEEILEIDAKRNHPPGTTKEDLIEGINVELLEGGQITRQGDVLIVYRTVEPGVVEHHSFNADTPANLLEANKKLWRVLKKAGAKAARTNYKNPKINQLLAQAQDEFDISIRQTGGGFVAEVTL